MDAGYLALEQKMKAYGSILVWMQRNFEEKQGAPALIKMLPFLRGVEAMMLSGGKTCNSTNVKIKKREPRLEERPA